MKKNIIIAVCSIVILSSCAPGANSNLEDHFIAYNWKITYLEHLNVDRTSEFTLYTFNFESNNNVLAIRADSTFQGTWTRSNASQSNPKILLNFGSHYQLSMLNYDWQQESRTDNTIKLVDDMSASSSEAATFERIP